jgi:hypothetical protein
MDPVLMAVASGASAVLAPFLTGLAGGAGAELEAVGGEAGASVVRRLWGLLSRFPKVLRVAEGPGDEYFDEDLTREIGRVLGDDERLLAQVADLLAQAQAAGAPVDGHALVERVRAGRTIVAEGAAATVRDADAGWDIVARADGAPDPKG